MRGWTSGKKGREHSLALWKHGWVALEGIRKVWGEVPSATLLGDHVLVRVGFRILPFFSRKRFLSSERLTILSYSYFASVRDVLPSLWIRRQFRLLLHASHQSKKNKQNDEISLCWFWLFYSNAIFQKTITSKTRLMFQFINIFILFSDESCKSNSDHRKYRLKYRKNKI